jgi:uncharacterized repeat protein (TIGR01451 family)
MLKLSKQITVLALLLAASVHVLAQPVLTTDLSIMQAASANPVLAGTLLDYAITVSNGGPDAADAIQVIDSLSAAVSYESNTAACVESPVGTVNCNLGALAAGESWSFTITVFVPSNLVYRTGGSTTIRNTVSVSNSRSIDPNPSNNSISLDLGLVASADLAILSVEVVEAPTELLVGQSTDLSLQTVLSNRGSSAPMDLKFQATSSSSSNALLEPAEYQLEELALDLNESRSLENVFTVVCNGGGTQTISFTAMIQPLHDADTDRDTSNNTASIELNIECLIPVEMDILPNDSANSINLNSDTEIPVAILSNAEFIFDASSLDPSTITLAGATVSEFGNGAYNLLLEDLNEDGLLDLLVYIQTAELELTGSEATLEASSFDGVHIIATDSLNLVGD